MNDLIVMTPAKAKSDNAEIVYEALREVAAAAQRSSGCIAYNVFRALEAPEVSVTFERWSSKAERDAFLGGEDVARFARAVSGSFAEAPKPASYQRVV